MGGAHLGPVECLLKCTHILQEIWLREFNVEVNFRYRTTATVRRIVVVASCVSVEKRFFMVTFFVAESFLHTMKVVNAF